MNIVRLIVLAALLLGCLCWLPGCVAGELADGSGGFVGFRVGDPTPGSVAAARKAGASTGAAIGNLIGGPVGATLGGLIGDNIGYILGLLGVGSMALRRGERTGWDEAMAEGGGKPKPDPGSGRAPAPVSTS